MIVLLYLCAIAFLVCFPADTAEAALLALKTWATSIVPVLFPYMVFSRQLCNSLDALHLPAFPLVAALGLLGGSPSGAAAVAANHPRLSPRSIPMLCALTGTVSPMFILGTIQGWIGQPALCRRLLLCHWAGALLCAWIIHHRNTPFIPVPQRIHEPHAETSNSISQSIDAVLQVGGCVILYSVLAGMAGKILHSFPMLHPIVHAAMEVAGGMHAICQSSIHPEAKAILLSAALGFGGFSILSQNHAMLKPLGVSMHQLAFFAILRAVLCAAAMCLILLLPVS